jgi:hypothetical protein
LTKLAGVVGENSERKMKASWLDPNTGVLIDFPFLGVKIKPLFDSPDF